MNQPKVPDLNGIALWDSDVEAILTNLPHTHNNPNVEATLRYLSAHKVFSSMDNAESAKRLVKHFNDEVQNATRHGLPAPHPLLTDIESATLMRLGIFSVQTAFDRLPGFEAKWKPYSHELDNLLKNLRQYADSSLIDTYNNDMNDNAMMYDY